MKCQLYAGAFSSSKAFLLSLRKKTFCFLDIFCVGVSSCCLNSDFKKGKATDDFLRDCKPKSFSPPNAVSRTDRSTVCCVQDLSKSHPGAVNDEEGLLHESERSISVITAFFKG